MIVCVCHRVSDKDIHHHASQGCVSFDALQMETGVSTCCGRCEDCAREVLDDALDASVRGRRLPQMIPIALARAA
jgi:bacterioferritin-associated ferredoxin